MKVKILLPCFILIFFSCNKTEVKDIVKSEILSSFSTNYSENNVQVTDIIYDNEGFVMELLEYSKSDLYYSPYRTTYFYVGPLLVSLIISNTNSINKYFYYEDSIVYARYVKTIEYGTGKETIFDEKHVYIKSNNVFIEERTYRNLDSVYQLAYYDLFHWTNGNLIKQERFSPYWFRPDLNTDFELESTLCFEYDSMCNPFNQIAQKLNWIDSRLSKNNVIRKIEISTRDTVSVTNYLINYNEYGLMISSIESRDERFSDNFTPEYHEFFYKKEY